MSLKGIFEYFLLVKTRDKYEQLEIKIRIYT